MAKKKKKSKKNLLLSKLTPLSKRLNDIKEKVRGTSAKKMGIVAGAGVALAIIFSLILLKDVPSPTTLNKDVFPVSTKILDRDGKLLYEIYAEENRTPIKLDALPDYVSQATIAIEDKNFYTHHGFDTQGILRAAFKTISGQRLEGGSTITQQLVKVALLTPERTIERKVKEAILSLTTEVLYSKNQILEMYLNHIPYGGTAYGIEAASQVYFNKPASELTLPEAALLAGLPQAPTRYSPFANPEEAKARQEQVLKRMVEENFISPEQKEEAMAADMTVDQPFTDIKAPHFVMYVREKLEEKYGIQRVEQGGLIVTTTLSLDLQEKAQASLSAEVEDLERLRVSNGAALVTNPQTGEILAMVGSRDYFDDEIDGRVNVTTRLRQPGSSIKPLNYALGLETKNITPSTMLLDTPICFRVPGQQEYCPRNYDNTYHGAVQIRYALGNSYNIPAVKVLALNDIENFMSFATKLGISSWSDPSRYGLSLTLGGGEVTMLDMAQAFGVFANSGTKVPLQPILKVETHLGETVEEYKRDEMAQIEEDMEGLTPEDCQKEDVSCPIDKPLSPQTAFLISHILQDNGARTAAFGPSSVLNVRGKVVSVKTGTTNDLRDNWTIGYTENLLVATWVGNNDNTAMSYVASGVTGASPIWNDIMTFALEGVDTPSLQEPEGIVRHNVCIDSGTLPREDRPCDVRGEYFIEGTVPVVSRIERKEIWINKDTGLPPQNEEEFGNIELQEHLIASDPFTQEYCLDCTQNQEEGGEGEEGEQEPQQQKQGGQMTTTTYTPGAFTIKEREE